MKNINFRQLLYLFLLLFSILILAGCWNRREIESIGFINSVGVDRNINNKIKLTVRIAKPFTLSGQQNTNVDERSFWLTEMTGDTVFEAVRNFLNHSPRRLFWAHNRFIIFGEEFARQGLNDAIDWFDRDNESRRTAQIAIVKGATAAESLQVEYELERDPSQGEAGVVEAAINGQSNIVDVKLHDFLLMLNSEGIEPVATRTDLVPTPQGPLDIRGNLKREKIGLTGKYIGAAAFKEDKLVGWLDGKQTRGLNWVKGKAKGGILVINNPKTGKRLVSIELIRSQSKIIPKVINGRPSIEVKVQAEGNIGDIQGQFDINLKTWEDMEKMMAEGIKDEIKACLRVAQKEFNSDIFGFGAAIYRNYPREWERLKNNWDEEFPNLSVKISVEAKLRRTGLILRTLQE
ncbi:MAG: spore germination protein [Clostridia bacterium]|nr:spore germination protein [Clostridia bacterium]